MTSIGTTGENHVILEDKAASMHHGQLHRNGEPAQYILMDAGSKAGTFVEGRQIFGATRLMPGQEIRMGNSTLVLKLLKKAQKLKTKSKPKKRTIKPLEIETPVVTGGVVVIDAKSKASGKHRAKPARPVVEIVGVAGEPEATPANVVFLTVEFGLNEGQIHELPLPITIGRSSKADVTIRDTLLSREHCKIEETVDGFSVTDLESSNGIRVHGERVEAGDSSRDPIRRRDRTRPIHLKIRDLKQQRRFRYRRSVWMNKRLKWPSTSCACPA